MKGIYRFHFEYGRGCELEGVFIRNTEDIAKITGKEIVFYDVFGKHSEIAVILQTGDMEVITEDQDFIRKFEEIMGDNFSVGHNPFHYLGEG